MGTKEDMMEINELNNELFASSHGLSKKFLDRNKEEVFKSNKAINDVLFGVDKRNSKSNINSLRDLSRLVKGSIRFKDRYAENAARTDDSGIKTLTPMGNIDQVEQELISQSATKYKSFLDVCPEYRGVVSIIPQVKRAIRNIVRDIMNVSELTGKCFNNVYYDEELGSEFSLTDEQKASIKRCSEKIKRVIDDNHLEEKNKRWIFESCVCGVKPVAFIPYKHIIEEMKDVSKMYHLNANEQNMARLKSGEGASPVGSSRDDQMKFERKAVENCMADLEETERGPQSVESVDVKVDEAFNEDIFDDELIEMYAKSCESSFTANYNEFKKIKERVANNDNVVLSAESSSVIEPNANLLDSIEQQYKENSEKLASYYTKGDIDQKSEAARKSERKESARKGLRILANWIDENISVVKPNFSSAYIANKSFKQRDRYQKFYNLGKDYKMAEGVRSSNVTGVMDNKSEGSRTDKESFDTMFDTTSALGKECLIIPYAPENVIPINVNGEYLGFYAIEYDNVTGNSPLTRRRSGSFTDYVRQQGFGDDKSLINGNGTPAMAYGGADPLESSLYSPVSLYNYTSSQFLNGGSDQDDERFDVLKTIVMRVLSRRLRDPDLAENKIFKDAIMTLLRNDALTKKRVQFTYIPPEYMCYMTYQVDDNGIPVSILDGTLFFAYLYISSVVSSGMIKLLKSSDKEKYEIDVGLQKNANYSITELQKTLSTRSLYSSGMFSSLSSVIKNAGSYQRLIIPVIKDKKLYDVTQMERVNNLDPDDNFTKDLLQSILDGIYINSGSFQEMDSADFAKQIFTRQLEYRNNIVDAQKNYFPNFITRQVRLCVKYSTNETFNSLEDQYYNTEVSDETREKRMKKNAIDLAKIDVKPSVPTYLSMTNIIENLNQAKDVAQNFAEVFDLQGGNETENKALAEFKKQIIQRFVQIVDWDELNLMLKACRENAKDVVIKNQKDEVVDGKITQPMDEDNDLNQSEISGEIGSSSDSGFGGGDSGGGDTGGGDEFNIPGF